MNEVLPLLFLSAKYEMKTLSRIKEEYNIEDMNCINKLDDFIIYDQKFELLTDEQYKLVEFIARMYVSDSKRYKD